MCRILVIRQPGSVPGVPPAAGLLCRSVYASCDQQARLAAGGSS